MCNGADCTIVAASSADRASPGSLTLWDINHARLLSELIWLVVQVNEPQQASGAVSCVRTLPVGNIASFWGEATRRSLAKVENLPLDRADVNVRSSAQFARRRQSASGQSRP